MILIHVLQFSTFVQCSSHKNHKVQLVDCSTVSEAMTIIEFYGRLMPYICINCGLMLNHTTLHCLHAGQDCSRYQFECHNVDRPTVSECIAVYDECDGIVQCSDSSDELSCPHQQGPLLQLSRLSIHLCYQLKLPVLKTEITVSSNTDILLNRND